MADISKIIDKADKVVDKADEKSKERQAMSENPEEEKKGITAKDMLEGGKEYAKDELKEKAVEKIHDKFLGKKDDDLLSNGIENKIDGSKPEINGVDGKSDIDKIGEKYLENNPNAENILQENSPLGKEKVANNQAAPNNPDGVQNKNYFGDSKNPNANTNANGVYKPDPNAGNSAVQAGAAQGLEDSIQGSASNAIGSEMASEAGKEIGKEVGKEASKEIGKEVGKEAAVNAAGDVASGGALAYVGDGVDIAKDVISGDFEKGFDDSLALGANIAVTAATAGNAILGSLASLGVKIVTKLKTVKVLKRVLLYVALGLLAIIFLAPMFIGMIKSELNRKISEIVENIPIAGRLWSVFVREELTNNLGIDFGDFDFEDIGQDSAKMEEYAKFKELFMEEKRGYLDQFRGEMPILQQWKWESDSNYDPTILCEVGKVDYDPEAMISDYLPLYSIFAGLENVEKEELAQELKNYFLKQAEFILATRDDVEIDKRGPELKDDKGTEDTSDDEYEYKIYKTSTPRLFLTKATSLTHIYEWDLKFIPEGEDGAGRWERVLKSETRNNEVIALFSKYKWTKDEMSAFEHIADQNPMNLVYDAGMYGFTSTFTMPIEDYRIAKAFEEGSHPYIEIAGDEGTEIKAIAQGTVEDIGPNYIKLKMGDGVVITYSNLKHLEETKLTKGATVVQGQVIATMTDDFLKMEARDKENKIIDPKKLLDSKFTPAMNHNLVGEYSMNLYKQRDYPDVDGVSMARSGCGPTSFAMVLSWYGQNDVSPAAVASKARSISTSLWYSEGASHAMFETLAPKYNIKTPEHLYITDDARKYITSGTSSSKINKVLNAIGRTDQTVIMLIHGANSGDGRASKFTSGGHYIVVDGTWENNGTAKILDPYSNSENNKWAYITPGVDTKDNLFSGAVQAWIFTR